MLACLALAALVWMRLHDERDHPSATAAAHGRTSLAPSSTVPPAPAATAAETRLPPAPSVADEDVLLDLLEEARRDPDSARRREKLATICLRWAGFDPPGAIELAADLRLDPLEGALVPNLAQQWAERDITAARDWAARLPQGALRDQVRARLVYVLGQAEPAEALRLAEKISAASEREEAVLSVLHPWARGHPAPALAWVRGLPDGPLRSRALGELEGALLSPSAPRINPRSPNP